jgi:hypothetical protein
MSTHLASSVDKSAWVAATLTESRFATYLLAANQDEAGALALYSLNVRVSAELYAWLGFLEVALRNALIRSLVPDARAQEFDPFLAIWADLTPPARANYLNAKQRLSNQGKPETVNGILTELPFGFWRYLASSRYQNTLWSSHLRFAFPGLWPQKRLVVYEVIEHAVLLRNRIAHHEPIFNRHLGQDLAKIQQIIGWISPEALEWARANLPAELIGVGKGE